MRLETHRAVDFDEAALSEPFEIASSSSTAAPAEPPPDEASSTLSEMGQQLPPWVKLGPPVNETAASAAKSPDAYLPPAVESQDLDAGGDRSADFAFIAQHQASLANMLEQAQTRLGGVDTFHHGVSQGYLDYASEMEFAAASLDVQRLQAKMAEGAEADAAERDASRQEGTVAAKDASATEVGCTGGQEWASYVAAHRVAANTQQLDSLLSANLTADSPIDVRPSTIYVQRGDSLSKIAARFPEFGSSNDLKNQLIASNPQLKDPNSLTEGMALNFPGARAVVDGAAIARAATADNRYQAVQAYKESEKRAQMLGLIGGTDPVPADPEALQFAAEYQARINSGPKASAYDASSKQARQQAAQRSATSIGIAAGGILTGWAAGAQLAGASDEVVNNLGVAQSGLISSLGGAAASVQSLTARSAMPAIPQGMTAGEFNAFSRALDKVISKESLPPGQTVVQGSRASGAARLDSDIDVLHIVKDADFHSLVANRLTQVQSPKIAAQITKTADLQGRLSGFQTSNTLEKSLWTEVYPGLPRDFSGTQFSVARESSAFRNGPLIPLESTPVAPRGPLPALPASAPQP